MRTVFDNETNPKKFFSLFNNLHGIIMIEGYKKVAETIYKFTIGSKLNAGGGLAKSVHASRKVKY